MITSFNKRKKRKKRKKKMIIQALSYQEALKTNTNIPIISIRDQYYKYKLKHKQILKIKFDDVTPYAIEHNLIHPFYQKEFLHRKPILFNRKKALEIIQFAEQVRNEEKDLLIHCWAGMSRSVAVGLTLNQIFNLLREYNPTDFEKSLKLLLVKAMPNPEVYRIMMKTGI